MRIGIRLWMSAALLSLALPALAQSTVLPTGQSQFAITQNGKTLGHTESNIARLSNGYQIESHGEMSLGKFHYSFTSQNRLDPELNVVADSITGTVNGQQASFHAASSTDGRTFIIHTSGGGKNETNTVTRHQNLVVLPDFDAASYVEMVHFAMERPKYAWILIPKQNGILVPCHYQPQADVRGVWNGTSIIAHHTTVIVSAQNAISVELYYSNNGTLLEADLPEQNFYVIRNGFRLINRPASEIPHVAGAPQQQQ
jgi:hypothetical protein